jgi:hypothetical protein
MKSPENIEKIVTIPADFRPKYPPAPPSLPASQDHLLGFPSPFLEQNRLVIFHKIGDMDIEHLGEICLNAPNRRL